MKSLSIILIFTFFSLTLFGQKNVPKFYSSKDKVWVNALGKTKSHPDVKKIMSKLGTPNELNDMDEFHGALWSEDQIPWHSKGVKMGFSSLPSKTLNHIYFYHTYGSYTAHKKLPFGMSFSDTSEKLKARYGNYLTEDKEGNFIVKIASDNQPFISMKISMDEGKVGHAITLAYDEYAAYKSNATPHNLEDDLDLCEAFSAMVKDVDNKFFSFRGEKTKDIFPSWKCNVILDTDDIAETKVYHAHIEIVGYEGLDHDKGALAFETLYGYFDMCVEDGEIPYSWERTEKETDTSFEITLTTKDKNVKVVHHFKVKEEFYNGKKQEVFSAYSLIRFSED